MAKAEKTDISAALEFMTRSAQEEYIQAAVTRRSLQYGIVKQYVWLSALIASGAFSLWVQPAPGSEPGLLIVFGLGLSILSSLAAFIISVLTLKGKGLEPLPRDRSWAAFADLVYDGRRLDEIQYNMLQGFSASIEQAYQTITRRGLRLRRACRLLIFSAVVLSATTALYGWTLHYGR